MRAQGQVNMSLGVSSGRAHKGRGSPAGALRGCPNSLALNALLCPKMVQFPVGCRLSPTVGLGCPQSPGVGCQDPGKGPLCGQPRVRVRVQEPSRANLQAVRRAPWRAEMRPWARVSMGLRVGAQGLPKVGTGSGGLPKFSSPLCSIQPQGAWFPVGWQAESCGGAQVSQLPGAVV